MNTVITVLALSTLAFGHVTKRDLVVQTNPGWTSLGCYSDVQSARTLRNVALQGDNVSGTVCQAECQRQGFVYAGTEYAGQCWCDNAININAKSKPDSDCNMACKADTTQPCGGPDRVNVFWNGTTIAGASNGASPNKTLAAGWTSIGCYSDSVQLRTLSGGYLGGPDTGMTIEYCVNGCAAKGWSYAGLEFGQECYCGNSIENNAAAANVAGCNMACQGDSTQTCGGQDRLQLYSASTRPAVVSSIAPSSSSAAPAVVSSIAPSSSSPAPAVVSSASPSSSSAAPAAASSAPPANNFPRYNIPDSWNPFGCHKLLTMSETQLYRTSMTPRDCVNLCVERGYDLSATDNGQFCRCGASSTYFKLLAPADQVLCNVPCLQNRDYICGGYKYMNVYQAKSAA